MSERFVQINDSTGAVFPKASKTIELTIPDSGWTSPAEEGGYYTITISDPSSPSLITADSEGILGLSRAATDAQYEASVKSQLRCIAQGAGTITVAAKKVPTTAIPCVLILLG